MALLLRLGNKVKALLGSRHKKRGPLRGDDLKQAMLEHPRLLVDTLEGLEQIRAGEGRKVSRRPAH
jgi:hypothetical protein